MPFENQNRRGRLDLLIKDGFGVIAERAGLRDVLQPVIDTFVDQKVKQHNVPVTPIEIAQHCGILRKPKPNRGAA